MKRIFGLAAGLTCILALTAPLQAQEAKPEMEMQPDVKEVQRKAMAASAAVRGEIVRQVEDAQKKLLALAEAMPAEKFDWRPGTGVRSAGEVFAHVSGANFFLPTLWGGKMPAGVDPRSFEKDGGDKAKTVATLKQSFDHVLQALQAVPDGDFDKTAKLFTRDGTVREAMLIVATHAHEHLGQAIAYARMNGVTPPWSAGQ
jgi:uncharacterized damage-inducible protein DinB